MSLFQHVIVSIRRSVKMNYSVNMLLPKHVSLNAIVSTCHSKSVQLVIVLQVHWSNTSLSAWALNMLLPKHVSLNAIA